MRLVSDVDMAAAIRAAYAEGYKAGREKAAHAIESKATPRGSSAYTEKDWVFAYCARLASGANEQET